MNDLLREAILMMRWLLFLSVVILIFLGFKFRLSTQIEKDVILAQAKTDLVEKHLIEQISATVGRWEQLRQDNPTLIVPAVTVTPTPSP